MGSIIIAYIIGCILGLTGVIPDTDEMHAAQTAVATYAIPFAIPLLLFSSDIRSWARLAPAFIKSTIFGVLGCVIAITVGFFICGKSEPQMFSKIGGMLTGLYTGGNANLASLKMALGVDDTTYILVSAYSTIMSAVYLFFVIIVGKRVLLIFMPDFKEDKNVVGSQEELMQNNDNELFLGIFKHDNSKDLVMALILTVIIIALALAVAKLFPKDAFQSVFILAISTLAVIASLNTKVRRLKRTFEAGTFFILIFSMAVASQVSLRTITQVDSRIFLFTTIATIGALCFHVLISAIFRIDTDTTLTTSISLICSPPFAPVIGSAINNRAVIGPGIAVGLFGYAAGTYIGFSVAKLLMATI